MSWSLSATGRAKDVLPIIAKQANHINLSDAGEMETVAHVTNTIAQALSTFDPEKVVKVEANGHMGFADWKDKSKPFQHVSLHIEPIHFTVE